MFKQFFNKPLKTIFVDNKSILLNENEMVDIILSPKYYWVKIEKLPVKFSFQAKEYSQSIFESVTPKGNYSYKVIKKNEKFIFFAYDSKIILENINTLGIKQTQIRDIYFAQNELMQVYKLPIKIDENFVLILHNEKIIKTPITLTNEFEDIETVLEDLKVSKHKIKLGKFNQIYQKKGIFGIIFALIFLIFIYLGESFYFATIKKQQEIQKDLIINKYTLPKTKIQLDAILKQYEKISATQIKLRDKLNEIFKLQFLNDEYIHHLKLNNSRVTIGIRVNDKNREEYYKQSIERFLIIDSLDVNMPNIIIQAHYE